MKFLILSLFHFKASSGALLIAAIDFGTTFSGWAYSFLYEFRSDPTKVKVKHWYPDTGFVVTEKTPTCALIKPDGKTLQAFGYEAENAYAELKDDERKAFYYFRRFKMALDKKVQKLTSAFYMRIGYQTIS